MAKTTEPLTVVIIDDEPHNIVFLKDYLEDSGYSVLIETDLNAGVALLSREIYRLAIIDLSIPVIPPLEKAVSERGALYSKYPGLFAAWSARNAGYRGRQVIVHTVHRDRDIADEAERLMCTYIMKGRPRMMKDEIETVLSFDPTSDD